MSASLVSPSFSNGWYDATSSAQYFAYVGSGSASAGANYITTLVDGGGNWTGVCGTSSNDLTITWTKTSSPGTANFAGVAYELI